MLAVCLHVLSTFAVASVIFGICASDSRSHIANGFFQTDNDSSLNKTTRSLYPTKMRIRHKKSSWVWSHKQSRCGAYRDLPLDSSCSDGALTVHDIVTSLGHCGWRHSAVIVSNLVVSKGDHTTASTEPFKRELVFPRRRHFVHKPVTEARRNLDKVPTSLIVQDVLKAFHDLLLPVQHFQLNSSSKEDLQRQLEEIIWTSYSSTGITNFVWISHKPWEIMQAARTLFRRHQRGRGALMPHRARFVLIGVETRDRLPTAKNTRRSFSIHSPAFPSWTSMLLKETEKQLNGSDFDNVLFLPHSYNTDNSEYHNVDRSLCFNTPETLMWRDKRKREFEPVTKFTICRHRKGEKLTDRCKTGRRRDCALLPNTQNGMNGRRLTFLTKEWRELLTVKGQGDSARFTGLVCEIANVLSVSMNFTYTFSISPTQSRNLSWPEIEKMISDGAADSLFMLYYLTASFAFSCSQPHPVYVINITGAYTSRPRAQFSLFISRMDPKLIILCFSSLTFVFLYYTCLRCIGERWMDVEKGEKFAGFQSECRVCSWKEFLVECWHTLFSLWGSFWGQGYVPPSCLFSGRILLFFWFFAVITVAATIRGYIAALLVEVDPSPPFKTFHELVNSKDYRWGTHKDSTVLPLMKADKDKTLHALYTGMVRFAKDDPEVLGPSMDSVLNKAVNDEKFVAIIDSFFLKDIIDSQDLRHVVRVIPDSIGMSGLAPVFPRGSELTDLMSEHIIAHLDTGIFNLLADNARRKSMVANVNGSSQVARNVQGAENSEEKTDRGQVVLYWLLLGAGMALGAALILFLEILSPSFVSMITWFRRKR
ncbi:glutamate receptor [Elysia marginata]|uniref:Glutamate receptor n=1 Tax=Elysia marginata TaxID=1093978 RepID=A0AAV4FKY2_9GAST|nr:glutamate receptor [Elysia marginata]